MFKQIGTQINIHSSTNPNSQKVKTTQMSINRWMDKNKCGLSIQQRLFSHNKEWNTDTCYNMDEPWKQKVKETRHKRSHVVWFLFIWNTQNSQLYTDTEQTGGCQGLGVGRKGELLPNGYMGSFWGDERVLDLERGDGCRTALNVPNATEPYTLQWLKW